ncbi:MAG: cytidylate kinase-like family protein [Lachnospiraceae bacterium]|jgi:cytidylate kinase|nr:cytidylate kinase-like family protein [Lachnospiraceae bacterium]
MEGQQIFTIGRRCGSGGRLVAEKVAETLGIKCYDKELLNITAKNSGLSQELLEALDEKPTNSFLYSLAMDSYAMGRTTGTYIDMPINHKMFLAQMETLKKLAADGESFVIIGRCADYALSAVKNKVTAFITADDDDCLQRLMELNGFNKEKARDMAMSMDKKRGNYYNYYTGKKWGDSSNYDICINTSATGIGGAVEILLEVAKQKAEILRGARLRTVT